jgi:hypothetical protein
MNSLRNHWNHFWFEAAAPDNLGLCRIILFGTMFLYYVFAPWLFPEWGYHQNFVPWASVSRALWSPAWLMSVLHLAPASPAVLEAIQFVWRLALLLSCIGLFTRISTAISLAFGVYLFGIPAGFGRIHHTEQVLVLAFLAMAFSRCGDAWSIDALVRKRKTSAAPAPPAMSGEYTWPIRMIWVVIVLIYFSAGISKARHSGFAWINSETMRNYLIWHSYHVTVVDPLTSWGPALARSAIVSRLLAVFGMGIELALPIALFSKRARWLLVPSVAAMQISIALLMGPNFYPILVCQLLWVPWDRVVAYFTRPRAAASGDPVLQPGA